MFMRDLLSAAQQRSAGKVSVEANVKEGVLIIEDSGHPQLTPADASRSVSDLMGPYQAAMALCDKIEVVSRDANSTVSLVSDGQRVSMSSESTPNAMMGTRVLCHLKPSMRSLATQEAARKVALEAAVLHRLPVEMVNGLTSELLNPSMQPAAPAAAPFEAPGSPLGLKMMRQGAQGFGAPMGLHAFNFWNFLSFSWNWWLEYRNIFIHAFRFLFQSFRPLIAVYLGSTLMKTVFSLTLSHTFLLFFSLMAGFEVFYLGLQWYISWVFVSFFSTGFYF